MRPTVLVVALLGASSVSTAPIPLSKNRSQIEFTLASRDGLLGLGSGLKSLKNMFGKKDPVTTEPITPESVLKPGTEEEQKLLTGPGSLDSLDTPAKKVDDAESDLLMKPSEPETSTNGALKKKKRSWFRDSKHAQKHWWYWRELRYDEPKLMDRVREAKYKERNDEGNWEISEGKISKFNVGAYVTKGLIAASVAGAAGYGIYTAAKPWLKEKSCKDYPLQVKCMREDRKH